MPPKIAQSVVVSSVSKALKSGLVVHYSVTEKVVGHFQVLLDARTAKHLGIKSPVIKGIKVGGLANPIADRHRAARDDARPAATAIAITFSKSAAAKLRTPRR